MRKTFIIFAMLLSLISCGKKEGGVLMNKVISKDGTSVGQGPAVILVDGAFCYPGFGPSETLARLLKQNFTIYTCDRRRRGNSSDTPPYAVEREIEDIDSLIKEAGGSAYVYGISSGISWKPLSLFAIKAYKFLLYSAIVILAFVFFSVVFKGIGIWILFFSILWGFYLLIR